MGVDVILRWPGDEYYTFNEEPPPGYVEPELDDPLRPEDGPLSRRRLGIFWEDRLKPYFLGSPREEVGLPVEGFSSHFLSSGEPMTAADYAPDSEVWQPIDDWVEVFRRMAVALQDETSPLAWYLWRQTKEDEQTNEAWNAPRRPWWKRIFGKAAMPPIPPSPQTEKDRQLYKAVAEREARSLQELVACLERLRAAGVEKFILYVN